MKFLSTVELLRGSTMDGVNLETTIGSQAKVDAHALLGGNAHPTATTSIAGFMSSSDKTKLDGIALNANNYVHPTTTGNKHIPAGGSTGNFLKYSSDGTAIWATPNLVGLSDTTISSLTNGQFLKYNGTAWINSLVTASDVGLENVTNESKTTMFNNAALTGTPTAPTASNTTNSTQIATTAFVKNQGYIMGNQNITVSGDATGSGTTAIALTLSNTGVTAGTYTSVTVDSKGRVTDASRPTTASELGITDVYTKTELNSTTDANSGADKIGSTAIAGVTGTTVQSQLESIKTLIDEKAATSHGNHVPTTETANNARFLRNDNTWQTVTPASIGAEPSFTKNTAFNKNFGTTSGTVAEGNHNHDSSYVKLSGGTLTGFLTLASDPTMDMHAVTKRYVDGMKAGLDVKDSVRVATTANIALSGLQTIDGISLVEGNRVLVKNQTDATQNGIYEVSSGAWVRAKDADNVGGTDVTTGLYTFVEEGTQNSASGWILTTLNPITVGTTSLNFIQFTGAGQITVGNGLVKSGNNIGHADTSSQSNVSNSGRTYIQSINVDEFGHITSISSATETVVNTDKMVAIDSAAAPGYLGANGTDGVLRVGSGLVYTDGGDFITIDHKDTSSQSSVTANGRTYITGVTLDSYGHVTGLTTGTETVVDTNNYLVGVSGSGNGTVTFTRSGLTDITWNSSHTHALSALSDATITTVADGQFLKYDGTAAKWINSALPIASTSVAGIVQLNSSTNSTSTVQAATASAVKAAYDLASGKAASNHTHSLTVSGDVSGSVTLDNVADTMSLTLANSGVTAGTYTKVTVDAKGRVTEGTTATPSDIGAEPAFTKNTAFNKNFGAVAGTVAEGNHTHTLTTLTDIAISSATNKQVLTYNSSTTKWENQALPTSSTSTAGIVQLSSSTSSTSTTLAATASAVKAAYDLANSRPTALTGLTDVTITTPVAKNFLRYDETALKWINGNIVAADLPSASTSAFGVVQLSDSISDTSTTLAATANAVKSAYDLAASKTSTLAGATDVLVTTPASDQFLKYNGTKWVNSALPTSSTSGAGIVQLSSSTNSTSTTLAATASAVKAAYDLAAGKSDANHNHDTVYSKETFKTFDVKNSAGTSKGFIVADTLTDIATFKEGTAIVLTPDATNDVITIAVDSTQFASATHNHDTVYSKSTFQTFDVKNASGTSKGTIVAETLTDTASLKEGTAIIMTADAASDTITIGVDSTQFAAANHSHYVQDLTNVTITNSADNDVLAWDSTSSKWINQNAGAAGLATATNLSNHTSNTNNPHGVTATQVGALVSVDGVSNAGGNIDFVAGTNISITPNTTNKTITFAITGDVPNAQTVGGYGAEDFILKVGDSMTGFLSLNADPTDDLHAVTKRYVDGKIQGLDIKDSVRVATTANITLSGTQTIDDVTLVVGDRVLVKNQTDSTQNGIYEVASGAWTRSTDADGNSEVTPGMFVFVEEGTQNADCGFTLSTNGTISVGTTGLTFTQFSGAGSINAGAGLTKNGNSLAADFAGSGSAGTVARSDHNHDSTYAKNTFANVKVGTTTITADSLTDTVEFIAGGAITLTGDATNDSVTIAHSDTSSQASITANGRTYVTGVTLDTYGHVTGLTTGTETVALDYKMKVDSAATADFLGAAYNDGILRIDTGGLAWSDGGNYVTISHKDTSSQSSITANGRTYVTGVTLDAYGHVTGLTTGTETVVDTNNHLTGVSGSGNGTVTFTRSGLANLTWDASHAHTMDSLTDTSISSLAAGHVLNYNGTNWVNTTTPSAKLFINEGYKTSKATATNQWTKIATTTLTAQGQVALARIQFMGGIDGGAAGTAPVGNIFFRVAQVAAMASAPVVAVRLMENQNIAAADIYAIITTNSLTSTVVDLYIKIADINEQYTLVSTVKTSNVTILESQTLNTLAPAGIGANINATLDTVDSSALPAATSSAYGAVKVTTGNGLSYSSGSLSHTTGAGYNHIPTGGAANQYLKYSSSGVAAWSALPSGTTGAAGIVQLTDSTSSTSTTTAATPNSVKSAYDLANAAVPKSGGTMTGALSGTTATMSGTITAPQYEVKSTSTTEKFTIEFNETLGSLDFIYSAS